MSVFYQDSSGTEHEFPDGTTPEQMARAVGETPSGAPRDVLANPRSVGPIGEPFPRTLARWGREALPTVAATGASMLVPELALPAGLARLAGPATALARAAAAAGTGAATAPIAGTPPAREAIEQGAGVLGGEGLFRSANALAHPLMDAALRASPVMRRMFPGLDFAGEALKEGVAVGSPAARQGSQEMKVRILKSDRALKAQLGSESAKATVADLSQAALKKIESELGRKATGAEKKQLFAQIRDEANRLLNDRRYGISPGSKTTFDPLEVKRVKQSAQRATRAQMRAESQGNLPAGPSVTGDLAKGANRAMSPAARRIEANTQRLIGTGQAIANAELRNPPPMQMRSMIGHVAGWAETPQFLSRTALQFNNPATQAWLRFGPQVLPITLDELLGNAPPDTTR